MKLTTLFLWVAGALVLGMGIWTAASAYIVWGIEEARYTVVAEKPGYQIRKYAPMLVAETAMDPSGKNEEGDAFRILAGYIFGGNKASTQIDMTAPVIVDANAPAQEIAMTAPVLIDQTDAGASMAFVLPSHFTRETLPRPNDSRVVIREVPARLVAVVGFSWFAPESRKKGKAEELLQMVARDGIKPVGAPVYAGYNPPFSAPFLKRHEIHVPIAETP